MIGSYVNDAESTGDKRFYKRRRLTEGIFRWKTGTVTLPRLKAYNIESGLEMFGASQEIR